MEEDKNNGNGKSEEQKPQFKQFVKIFFNDETGDYAFETNVPNAVIGYGMLEFGKRGVDAHITKARQQQVIPAKGGIFNFARRLK